MLSTEAGELLLACPHPECAVLNDLDRERCVECGAHLFRHMPRATRATGALRAASLELLRRRTENAA